MEIFELFTGLPGHFKTTRAVELLLKKSESEKRQVYYHNLSEFKGDWLPVPDPYRWFDIPDGSILFIDEAQRVFPPLKQGAPKPEHYAELSTHRHRGIDIVLICQHPSMIDIFVRRLVQKHEHLNRAFGAFKVAITTFQPGVGNVESGLKEGKHSTYSPDRSVHKLYKSAELHTVKRKIPFRFMLGLIAFILFFGLIGYMIWKAFIADSSASIDDVVPEAFVPEQQVNNRRYDDRKLEYTMNEFNHGWLEGKSVFYLGNLGRRKLFLVDGVVFKDRVLTRLGYRIDEVDEGFIAAGKTLITMQPEYVPQNDFENEFDGENQRESSRDSAAVASVGSSDISWKDKPSSSLDTPVSAFYMNQRSQQLKNVKIASQLIN